MSNFGPANIKVFNCKAFICSDFISCNSVNIRMSTGTWLNSDKLNLQYLGFRSQTGQ